MAVEDNMLGITAIVGEEGTGKTSMALSFPKKVAHFDIDVGGYRRAAWRLDTDGITSKPYPKPLRMEKLLGQQSENISSRIEVKFPKKVEGMKELWQQIVVDFVAACQDQEINTIIFDSATLLWNICHNSVLQEAQERQLLKWQSDKAHKDIPFNENDYRERLQAIEYGPANDKMTQLFHTARAFNKNLVLTHYPTDVYGPMPDGKGGFVEARTGEKMLDGYKNTAKLVDVVVWLSLKSRTIPADPKTPGSKPKEEKYPVAKFHKVGIEGMGISAVGMEIPASFDGITNLRNIMRAGRVK
jgi:hypothetical protein